MADAQIRVLVTGGRDYTDRAAVTRALSHLGANYIFGALPEEIVLVHGGCTGADTLAAEEAVKLGWRTDPRPDKDMVRFGAAYAVVFPGGQGTARCRRLAFHARIPVIDVKESTRV